MNRQMLDRTLPLVYALVIVVVAMTVKGPTLGVVTVAGAMLLAVYYAGIRPSLVQRDGGGRQRHRARNRNRAA